MNIIFINMDLKIVKGIGKVYEKKLKEAGIKSLEELAVSSEKEIAEINSWKEEARKIAGMAKAIIIEEIPKISFIEIEDGKARVKIKEYWHDAKIFQGNFDEIKQKVENEKVAIYLSKKPKLWFNGEWYDGVPYKIKKRWWRK